MIALSIVLLAVAGVLLAIAQAIEVKKEYQNDDQRPVENWDWPCRRDER